MAVAAGAELPRNLPLLAPHTAQRREHPAPRQLLSSELLGTERGTPRPAGVTLILWEWGRGEAGRSHRMARGR